MEDHTIIHIMEGEVEVLIMIMQLSSRKQIAEVNTIIMGTKIIMIGVETIIVMDMEEVGEATTVEVEEVTQEGEVIVEEGVIVVEVEVTVEVEEEEVPIY